MKQSILYIVLLLLFFTTKLFPQFGPPIDSINVVNGWKFVGSIGGNMYDTAYTRMDTISYHGTRFRQVFQGDTNVVHSNYSQIFVISTKDANTQMMFEKKLNKTFENPVLYNIWLRPKLLNSFGSALIEFLYGDGKIWVSSVGKVGFSMGDENTWIEINPGINGNLPPNFIVDRIRIVFSFSYGSYGNLAILFDDYSLIADKTIFDVPNIIFDSTSVIDNFENVSILSSEKDTLLMNATNPSDMVSITNNGNSDMFISHIETTNALFSVPRDTLTIPVGESKKISTTFDFANAVGIINAKLIIYSNSMTSPDTLTLKGDATTGIEQINSSIPKDFILSQNYPNPFNPSTKIRFNVAKQSFVTLKVYDLLGREVITLVNGEKSVGSYEVTFDASKLPSGVYIYRLQADNFSKIKKMVLMK